MESKNDIDIHKMDTKIIIKQEPCWLEMTSTEFKSESEETRDSVVHVKSEPSSFASVFLVQSDSNTHEYYHEMDAKVQIKEEPGRLEGISPDSREIRVKDADVQGNISEDQFILPDSSRVDAEAVWHYESDVPSAPLGNDCLKLRENNGSCHEKSHKGDITETVQVDDKILHKCKYCGRCFSRASRLKTHVETHENEANHKCSVCDKNFVTASRLKRHSFIHAGIRPFKCDKCEKSFTISSNLSRHKLYHEGKRRHKCEHCDKTFIEASHLKTHNLIHEGKRPFKCNKCDKSFTTSSNLKTHNLFHEGKKPHKCEICEKRYIIASHLKHHRMLIHGEQKQQKSEILKFF